MKIKNFKIVSPSFLAFVLAITLVSCHHDNVRRENERREEAKKYFEDLPRVRVEEIFEPVETNTEEEIIDNEINKTR